VTLNDGYDPLNKEERMAKAKAEERPRPLHTLTGEVKQAAWDAYKARQRGERIGVRQVRPSMSATLAAETSQADRAARRRARHKARGSHRHSPDHHAARQQVLKPLGQRIGH
jgi:hypothetical protein